ncbi:hypothetical protein L211DRAFT_834636 [Terfezia boudieri ATCC MYA-4762]|uniref:ATP-dependent DNA ligase family profile domain-containing protein n=1 Tax=Terfezia boudieri ATCC MYA-4762 TaxID=1051890 RepID=A0A3N4LVM7_9PEZI|nr:hypothetical protein L211DRAFT_834636 [Terfezia boudieri ATCC MYA-4762]
MPFPYMHVVSLLNPLSDIATRKPPPKPAVLKARYSALITSWFDYHRPLFTATKLEPIALFSLLFPELRTDRVYNLREDGLVRVIARCLCLGVTRQQQLSNWRRDADGDLGKMVGRVMRAAENSPPCPGEEVTVEEIEKALEELASRSIFSSQSKRTPAGAATKGAHEILTPLFRRMSSSEGMWLTRAILKSYLPAVIPEKATMYAYHFLLPSLWGVQGDLRKCLEVLGGSVFRNFPPAPEKKDIRELLKGAGRLVRPEVGVRVGRVEFLKARSCKNVVALADGQRMSMERKYDGEYCQIHIDLSKGKDWIKIFSKSGRDSTQDRARIHGTVREALRILKPEERGFKQNCILEGEMVVYCEKEKRILEFYHLRSHISRSGVFIGTSADERPDFQNQHLMLILFDILLLDSQPYLSYSYDRRITALSTLIQPRPGYIELASRFEINFSNPIALDILREQFAHGITQRWEGFVLKPCEGPYLDLVGERRSAWIKLKKDYIRGMGDTADFAVVGAGFEAQRGRERAIGGWGFTTFFVGVLRNKEGVVRFGSRPAYHAVFHISYCISKPDLEHLKNLAYFRAKEYKKGTHLEEYDLEVAPNLPPIDVYFTTPLVFEVMGGGFDRPSNCDYYILRWPRVVKIHWDRDWRDAVGFDELQELAEEAIRMPKGRSTAVLEEEEERRWVKRLEQGDQGGKRKQRDEGASGTTPGRQASHAASPMEDVGGGKRRFMRRVVSDGEDSQQQSQSQDSEMETPPRSQQRESSWSPASSPSQQPREQSREQQPQRLLSSPQPLPQAPRNTQQAGKPLPSPPTSSAPVTAPPAQVPGPSIMTTLSPLPLPTPFLSSTARAPLHPLPTPSVINALPPPPAPHPPCPSPLHNATIFLIPSVHAQSRLSPLLALHKPKAVYFWTHLPSIYAATQAGLSSSPEASQLASITPSISPPGNGATAMTPPIESNVIAAGGDVVDGNGTGAGMGKIILLIDFRTPGTSKKFIAKILEKAGLEPGAAGIDCYDWRVVGHSDWKGERRLDLLDKDKEGENVDASGDGNGNIVAEKGGSRSGSGRRRKVDWDLFYMVSV